MHLGDGRRILSAERLAKEPWRETEGGIVKMHPDFRMWVLANRPGFPFLGNNFFRECGDVFTVHTVDNPDLVSEASLLANYAPTTSPLLLDKMAKAFARLRDLHQAGVVAYPYSIREAVAVVRHLEQFPEDGLGGSEILTAPSRPIPSPQPTHQTFHTPSCRLPPPPHTLSPRSYRPQQCSGVRQLLA